MTASHVWHLWPARHWPASADEEIRFVADLDTLSRGHDGPRPTRSKDPVEERRYVRVNVTAVLNALRCGVDAAQLLALLPGAHPADLLEAYTDLEERRCAAVRAWEAVVQQGTWEAVQQHGSLAAVLMPVPIHRILTVAGNTHGRSIGAAVRAMSVSVTRQSRTAARVESELVGRTAPDPAAVRIGTYLHNPMNPALWGSPYYLPERITTLSAPRVADLLGERDGLAQEPLD